MATDDPQHPPQSPRRPTPAAPAAPDYLAPYQKAVAHFGPSFEATLWGSRDAQILRFDVFAALVDFTGCTILDVGSGNGDLPARLLERDIDYRWCIGIDGVDDMIRQAAGRQLPRTTFITGDVLADPDLLSRAAAAGSQAMHNAAASASASAPDGPAAPTATTAPGSHQSPSPELTPTDAQVDYICFSGSLNTMDEAVARRLVDRAFDAAAQGVIFNFLSNRCHPRWHQRSLGPARRFNTLAWLDWAMSRTSRVAFTQDYLDGHDATLLLRHDGE